VKQDPELVEFVRKAYSHPVSDDEARAARNKIVRDVGLSVVLLLAWAFYSWYRGRGLTSLLPLVAIASAVGWNEAVRYRVARPREGTPVPDDVLGWAVKRHTRCRRCRSIVGTDALFCQSCGILVAVSPGFWIALAIGLTAFAALVWWRMP
jgi:hypothetical protein